MSFVVSAMSLPSLDAGLITFEDVTPGTYTSINTVGFTISAPFGTTFDILEENGNRFLSTEQASFSPVLQRADDPLGFFELSSIEIDGSASFVTNARYGEHEFLNNLDDDNDSVIDEIDRSIVFRLDSSSGFQRFTYSKAFSSSTIHAVLLDESLSLSRFDNIEVQVASTVPEPSSFALLAVGLIGLAFATLRRRKPNQRLLETSCLSTSLLRRSPRQAKLLIIFIVFASTLLTNRAPAGLIVQDSTFDDWQFETVNYLGFRESTVNLVNGGDGIAVEIDFQIAPSTGYVILRPNENSGGIFGAGHSIDPSQLGDITSFNFHIDATDLLRDGRGQAVDLVLIQDGTVYRARAGTTQAFQTSTISRTQEASEFVRLRDPLEVGSYNDSIYESADQPNLTSTGSPFRVGFAVTNSHPLNRGPGNLGPHNGYIYDNFFMEIEHSRGDSALDPILPGSRTDDGGYVFENVPSGQWYDPFVSDYDFQTLDGSLFTSILDFPTGFDSTFDVFTGGDFLGTYGPGEAVDFGSGVSEFSIRGITPLVDSDDPLAFPIQLDFDRDVVSFSMTPSVVSAVPEPSSWMLFAIGIAAGFTALTVGRGQGQLEELSANSKPLGPNLPPVK